ncbi:MAG: T9SS type A sorting domain-containing protein, partial [Cytophagales bacterium]|nr:T9SS type A sorting domain-containing protein [Cytophagales bacterium]
GNSAAPLTASGSNLQWYTSTTECSGVASAPVPSTSSIGTTTYYVTGKEGACESERKEIQVIVSNGPAKPTATTTINYALGAVSSALTASGTNLLWYESSVGGIGTNIAPVPSTSTVGTVTYYVSQQVGGCESERLAIQVLTSNADVTGPSCFVAGETVPFELNPKYTQNAKGYSWWVNGDVKSVSPSSGSPKTMITVGPYYKSGSVCVVINYSVSPWSKKICTNIDVCAGSARMAEPEESVNIYPNPSTGYFNISTVGDIQNLTVKNLFGQTVYTKDKISAEDTVYFGVDLPTGIYTVTYQTVSGKVQTTSVVKQ